MPATTPPRLLVVGDSNLDRYFLGRATRVCPESPALVLEPATAEFQIERPGGAAAVAYIAAGLGADVSILDLVGDDDDGFVLRDLLCDNGVKRKGPFFNRTTVKYRVCAESNGHGMQQIVRLDENHINTDDLSHLVEKAFADFQPQCVLIADYGRGVCSPEVLAEVMRLAKDAGVPVLVDPARGIAAGNYVGASLIKMNRDEAMASSSRGARFTMTTLDKEGAELIDDWENMTYSAPSLATAVVDVTGAGDAILAALGVLVARSGGLDGIAPERLLRVAMRAAAAEVAQFGVSQIPVSVLEDEAEATVKEYLTVELPDPIAARIYTADEIVAKINSIYVCQRPTVALLNGCYDMLHCGHLATIFEAASEAEIIIVAINSDASVRRLKGDARPIQSQTVRAAMVEAVKRVDYVVIFDEDTPLNVITAIRPDVLVRGDEGGEVVGREFIESYGGRVHLVPKLPGFSTSASVERMKR